MIPIDFVPFPSTSLYSHLLRYLTFQQAAHQNDFADVVGGVVGNEQGLAQNGLAGAVRDGGQQVGARRVQQMQKPLPVLPDMVQGCLPLLFIGGSVGGRPVALRKFWRLVFGVDGELHNIPLRDADMLDQLPDGVGHVRHALVPGFGREVSGSFFEGGVSVAFGEQAG